MISISTASPGPRVKIFVDGLSSSGDNWLGTETVVAATTGLLFLAGAGSGFVTAGAAAGAEAVRGTAGALGVAVGSGAGAKLELALLPAAPD
jgi:hypothetical protein